MKDLTLSIAQMAPTVYDIPGNLAKITGFMEEAATRGSDLLVIPEMGLTGYGIEDALHDPARRARLAEETRVAVARIRTESQKLNLDILVSFPFFSRAKNYIAAEYIASGRRVVLHRKINLCNYAHYTEHLHFDEGNGPTVARTQRGVFGLLVCEDVWHAVNGIVETLSGAEVILVPSAPCVREMAAGKSSLAQWEKITRSTAFLQTSYLAMAARVGIEGANHFLGGSHVVSPEGEIICEMPLFQEAVSHVCLSGSALEETRAKRPLLRNERASLYGRVFRKLGVAAGKGGKEEK